MKCTMRGQVIGIKASSITARWVGCDNRAALSRHVIQSADSRAQTMMSNRAETFDEEPVEHLAFLPADELAIGRSPD